MAVITPVGKMDFDWSPVENKEEQILKTASTADKSTEKVAKKGIVAKKSDKDLLYEAAKKVIEAQFGDTEIAEDVAEDVEEIAEDVGEAVEEVEDVSDVSETGEVAEEEAVADVQEAVAELVEKAQAADEVAVAVADAVATVEEAVAGVKAAIGGEGEEEEVEIDIEGPIEDESVELEVDLVDEEGGEDIIQESDELEACGSFAKVKRELKKEAVADDFQRISKISPTTKKKIIQYWKTEYNYAPDYVALMATNYEK